MADPTDKMLRSDIADILKGADLTTLSSKKIRKQLEEKYGLDLTDRKAAIDKMIMEMLTLEQNRQSAANSKSPSTSISSSSRTTPKTENGDENSDSQGDDDDEDDYEPDHHSPVRKKSRTEKKSKTKSSSNEDSDGKDEDSEMDDEDIARQLQDEEHKAARKTRGSNKPTTEKKKTSRSKKEPGSGSSRKTNKYTEPCYLSPQLAAIMGEARLKRSDVVKKMWAIVKERNLYDPRDKRYMICDAEMQSVFGCKKVQIFGMMKYLKHHITSPGDVA